MAKRCSQKKVSILIVLILLLAGFNSMAQINPPMGSSPWKYVVPFQHGFNMNDISFIDNRTGLAVGGNGAIARTTDSGRNWQYIPFKYINVANTVVLPNISDVHFVTPTIAYAVGSAGLMIKSTDGGLNWTQIATPLTPGSKNINGLHFLNKDTGYIGGAAINTTNTTSINDAPKVYFTRNGGATWDSLVTPFRRQQYNTALPPPATILSGFNNAEIHRIHFVNDSVGYISGSCGQASPNFSAILWKFEKGVLQDYSLHRTKFGVSIITGTGANPAQCTQTYKGLVGINDSLVLISSNSNGIIVRVRTGKNDSTANAVPAIYGAYERGVYELVAQLNTFPTFPANSPLNTGAMWHLKKISANKIAISNGRSIGFTTDNGTTWTATSPTPATSIIAHWGFQAMDVTSNGRVVVKGANGLTYDSLPGAAGWSSIYKNIRPLFNSYSDMDWADHCNGIVVGANGSIANTTDGGKNWNDLTNPIFEASQIGLANVFYPAVNNMFFSTSAFGFVTICRSADQGASYTPIFTEPNQNTGGINNFTMVGNRAWAVAHRFSPEVQRTMIFRTLNANAVTPVWDTVKTFPTAGLAPQLRNIKFANQDTGYTSGSRGKVYRTVNGGTTWTDVSPDTLAPGNATATYTGLSVVNGRTLYVGGSSKKLFRSTDAGATWTDLTLVQTTNPITITAFSSVSNIVMNDANNGYLTTGNLLLRTNDGWATWTYDLSPQTPANIALYPKISAPIQNKKLYLMPLVAGFGGPISTASAALIEYGDVTMVNVSSTETITGSCQNGATGSIVINAVGGIAPYTYSINGGPFQTSNTFNGLTSGNKTITIKDAACGSITKTVTVAVKNNPGVNAGPDKIIVDGDAVTLNGSGSSNPSSITWTPNSSLSNSNTYTPIAKPNTTTTYTLTVVETSGCTSSDNVVVTVIPYCVKPMNAFTPNGDGFNDRWLVTSGGSCTQQVIAKVFNRYGELVYSNENYNNDWDGKYKGKAVADGTYYYVLQYKLINGNSIPVKGDVTILR